MEKPARHLEEKDEIASCLQKQGASAASVRCAVGCVEKKQKC